MRTALLPALLLPLQVLCQSPDWLVNWPVDFEMNPGMPRHVLASSPNGHLMSARLELGTFTYGQDVFGVCRVENLDPGTGQPLWSCLLPDSVTVESGAVDADGNIYVAGRFMSMIALCDGSILGHTNNGQWDVDLYLMKYGPDGAILWARNLSITDASASTIPVLEVDPSGALWYATCDFMWAHIVRVDEMGNDVESRVIDGAKTIGGMDFSPSGALYVSGAADNGGFAFGGASYQPTAPYSMFALRYSPQGTADWVEFAEDITFQHPDIAVDEFGTAYVCGDLFDATTWGNVQLHGPIWGSDTFIAKADSSGSFIWGVESSPESGPIAGDMEPASRGAISLDGNGLIHITGTLRGMVDWGNGVVSDGEEITERTQSIVTFDSNGLPMWATTSAPSSIFLQAMSITSLHDGTIYFSSHANGEYDFPPFAVNVGGAQAYVLGRIGDITSGAPEHGTPAKVPMWPVPASTVVNLDWSGPRASVQLFTSTGQLVRNYALVPGTNTLDISGLGSGVYTLVGPTGERSRLVKE